MINLKNTIAGALFGAAIFGGGSAVLAQQTTVPNQNQQTFERPDGERRGGRGFGDHGRKGFGGARGFAALNLTQKTQIEAIRTRFRESTQSLREQLRAAHEAERSATANNSFNESAIRAAAQASNNARVELAVAEARMRYETFNVLTNEQKAQIEQFKQQREQRREQFKSRRQAAQQQPIS